MYVVFILAHLLSSMYQKNSFQIQALSSGWWGGGVHANSDGDGVIICVGFGRWDTSVYLF